MSKIVDFRTRIMEAITALELFAEVDWYDGVFDQTDIEEWSLRSPSAFVSVRRAPTEHHGTGELNADLRCVVAIIAQDRTRPRDADTLVWDLIEAVSDLANLNKFGDPNAGAATGIKFERLVDPELRREGVAVGVVEWCSNFTFGTNTFDERNAIYHNGVRITQTPETLGGRASAIRAADKSMLVPERQIIQSERERETLRIPEDEA